MPGYQALYRKIKSTTTLSCTYSIENVQHQLVSRGSCTTSFPHQRRGNLI